MNNNNIPTMADYVRSFNLPTALQYLDAVVESTARITGVPPTELFGKSREGTIAVARRLALEVFREKYPYFPATYVAKAFNRTPQWANWTRREALVERKWEPLKQAIRDTLAEVLTGKSVSGQINTVNWGEVVTADE